MNMTHGTRQSNIMRTMSNGTKAEHHQLHVANSTAQCMMIMIILVILIIILSRCGAREEHPPCKTTVARRPNVGPRSVPNVVGRASSRSRPCPWMGFIRDPKRWKNTIALMTPVAQEMTRALHVERWCSQNEKRRCGRSPLSRAP